WYGDGQELCPEQQPEVSGDISCSTVIPDGLSIVSVSVTDPRGGSGSDQITILVSNPAPTVAITSHNDGAILDVNQEIQFEAVGDDVNDSPTDLTAAWFAGQTEICPPTPLDEQGQSRCAYTIEPTDESITVKVTDPGGEEGSDTLSFSLERNEEPEVLISKPIQGDTYYSDQKVEFSGSVIDSDTPLSDLEIYWESDIDGTLSLNTTPDSGGAFSDADYLTQGEHFLQLHARDPAGNIATDTVLIMVGPPNEAPICSITSPPTGSVGNPGDLVLFEATVSDSENAPNELLVQWSSDKDGLLGTSTPSSSGAVTFPYTDLSNNTHLITLEVVDEVGTGCVENIIYTVGNPPSIQIQTPSSGSTHAQGEPISFSAVVSDVEDASNSLSVSWESSLDGIFSTQSPDSSGSILFNHSSLQAGVHTISAEVRDSNNMSASAQLTLTINGLPSAPTVSISPDPAYSDSTLTVLASGSVDPEGNIVTYAYEWLLNGSTSGQTGTSIASSLLEKGQVWTAIATPNDGTANGYPGQASVTIQNSPPLGAGISLSPSPAYNDSLLSCTGTATDTDGDALNTTYTWESANGILGSGSNLTLDASLAMPQESVSCTMVTSDGTDVTEQTASTTLQNRAPLFSSISITPNSNISPGTVLTCSAIADDADGETLVIDYEWYKNGTLLQTGGNLVVPSISTSDQLSCTATTSDAYGGSDSISTSISMGNSAPEIISVQILPSAPTAQTGTLTCSATTTDADGDSVTLSYIWTVDGITQSTTGPSLSGPFTYPSSISCTATPTDGIDQGTPATAYTDIENTIPSIASVFLTPSGVYTNDLISASFSVSDPDATQSTSSTLEWHRIDAQTNTDSVVATSGTSLDGSVYFDKGDTIYLVVTPFDGFDYGSPTTSNNIVVLNSAPSAPTIYTGPVAPEEGIDDIYCYVNSQSSDADGDTVQYTYVWTDNNGTAVQTTTTTALSDMYPGTLTSAGFWTCSVTADDGSTTSTTVSANLYIDGSCLQHLDCPSGHYCAPWRSDSAYHCSAQCSTDTDCNNGESCVKLPGGANVFYCEPVPNGTYATGNSCSINSDCESGICNAGYCESSCDAQDECSSTESCHMLGNAATGEIYSSCATNSAAYADINQPCNSNGAWDSANCETGHCDLHQFDGYFNGADRYCRPLCNKESDCNTNTAFPEVCDVVIMGNVPASNGIPIALGDDPSYSTVTACYEPWQVSNGAVGDVCSSNTDCATNKCFTIMPGSSQYY
ncbi:MAG: hypothetical protein VX278_04410, partial [Myxococcota bacterium]|nr:hypothetical protein [Myxococcota bacterium]